MSYVNNYYYSYIKLHLCRRLRKRPLNICEQQSSIPKSYQDLRCSPTRYKLFTFNFKNALHKIVQKLCEVNINLLHDQSRINLFFFCFYVVVFFLFCFVSSPGALLQVSLCNGLLSVVSPSSVRPSSVRPSLDQSRINFFFFFFMLFIFYFYFLFLFFFFVFVLFCKVTWSFAPGQLMQWPVVWRPS